MNVWKEGQQQYLMTSHLPSVNEMILCTIIEFMEAAVNVDVSVGYI